MAVKKPLEKTTPKKIDIEKLITKGAAVKEDSIEKDKKWTHICLRIPTEMVNKIDVAVEERIGVNRTGWILEAIHDKLKHI